MDLTDLEETIKWAFGRKDGLQGLIYTNAVAEVERLARLGHAIEASADDYIAEMDSVADDNLEGIAYANRKFVDKVFKLALGR